MKAKKEKRVYRQKGRRRRSEFEFHALTRRKFGIQSRLDGEARNETKIVAICLEMQFTFESLLSSKAIFCFHNKDFEYEEIVF